MSISLSVMNTMNRLMHRTIGSSAHLSKSANKYGRSAEHEIDAWLQGDTGVELYL